MKQVAAKIPTPLLILCLKKMLHYQRDTSASGAEESISESYIQCLSDEPESGLSETNDDVVTGADIGTVDDFAEESGVVKD